MKRSVRITAALAITTICFVAGMMSHARAQIIEGLTRHGDSFQPLAKMPSDGKCPPAASGASATKMILFFSVSDPRKSVSCTYADGSSVGFVVEQGCGVEPVSQFVDGVGFGRHECRETEPGAQRCHIECRSAK